MKLISAVLYVSLNDGPYTLLYYTCSRATALVMSQ